MNPAIKNWLVMAFVAALVGVLYVWINGIPGTTATKVDGTSVSQTVPTPGPGQKKVVLQNLGMA